MIIVTKNVKRYGFGMIFMEPQAEEQRIRLGYNGRTGEGMGHEVSSYH